MSCGLMGPPLAPVSESVGSLDTGFIALGGLKSTQSVGRDIYASSTVTIWKRLTNTVRPNAGGANWPAKARKFAFKGFRV